MSEEQTPVVAEPGFWKRLGSLIAKWVPIAWQAGKRVVMGTPAFAKGPLLTFIRKWCLAPAKRAHTRFGPKALWRGFAPKLQAFWKKRWVVALRSGSLRALRVALAGGLLAVLIGGGFALCTHRVPPGVIAVRHARFFSGGVDPDDYTTGMHFGLWGVHDWHYLPARTCYLTYANKPLPGELALLKVRTKDGNVARVGVTVPYRIITGEAHALVAEGLKEAYVDRVRATVEKILLQELANLSSSDFATTDTRLARATATLEVLNRELRESHVRAENVVINSVYFPGDYELKLQETQLLAQQTIMNRALVEYENSKQDVGIERARIESAERDLRGEYDMLMEQDRADAEREIAVIRTGFLKYRGQREGQAMAEYDQLIAEGEAAMGAATAYRTKKFAEIYRTPGGRMYLASIAASNLNIDEVTLNANDPNVPSVLNLDELVGLLVGGGL